MHFCHGLTYLQGKLQALDLRQQHLLCLAKAFRSLTRDCFKLVSIVTEQQWLMRFTAIRQRAEG
jgi:hypothetical protein